MSLFQFVKDHPDFKELAEDEQIQVVNKLGSDKNLMKDFFSSTPGFSEDFGQLSSDEQEEALNVLYSRPNIDSTGDPIRPSWGEVISKGAKAIGPSMKKGVGGVMEMAGESLQSNDNTIFGTFGVEPKGQLGKSAQEYLDNINANIGEDLKNTGGDIAVRATKDLQGLRPDNMHFLQEAAYSTVNSLGEQAPSILASMITKDPKFALTYMFGSTAGRRYDELIQQGVDHDKAVNSAVRQGAIEVGTEAIPLDRLIKIVGKRFKGINDLVKNIAEVTIPEATGEYLAEVSQIVEDAYTQNPDMTTQDVVAIITDPETQRQGLLGATSGVFSGTVMGAGGHVASKILPNESSRADTENVPKVEESIDSEIADLENDPEVKKILKAEIAKEAVTKVNADELKPEEIPDDITDEFGLDEYKGNSLQPQEDEQEATEQADNKETPASDAEAYEEENLEPELTTENWKQFFIDQYGDEAEIASDEAVSNYMWNPDADFVKPPEDVLEAYAKKVGGDTDIETEIAELEQDPDVQAALGFTPEDVKNQSNDAQQMIENDQTEETLEMVDNKVVNESEKVDNTEATGIENAENHTDQTNELNYQESPVSSTVEESSAVPTVKKDLTVEQNVISDNLKAGDRVKIADGRTGVIDKDAGVFDQESLHTGETRRFNMYDIKLDDGSRTSLSGAMMVRLDEETTPNAEADNIDVKTPLTIEDYSEKSIIVRGDTKTHKDKIKAIGGGIWNKKAQGWIFSKKRAEKVEEDLWELTHPPVKPIEDMNELIFAGLPEKFPILKKTDIPKRIERLDQLDRDLQETELKEETAKVMLSAIDSVESGLTAQKIKNSPDYEQIKKEADMFISEYREAAQQYIKPDKKAGPDIEVAYIGDKNGSEAEKVKKDIEDKITEKVSGDRDYSKPIGKNIDGKDVYEDENGVRSYTEGNFKISEPVAVIPGRGGMAKDPEDRIREKRYDHLTVEEVDTAGINPNKQKDKSIAEETETADNRDTQENEDELLQRSTRPHEEVSAEQVSNTQEPGETGGVSGERGAGSIRDDRYNRGSDDTELRGPQSTESASVLREGAEERGVSSGSTGDSQARSDTTSGRSGLDRRAGNYRITESDEIGSGGAITKAKNNLAAIRLIKQLDEENRQATPEEQAILVKYVGWGGLVNMFPSTGTYKDGWEKYGEELKELLTKEEYEAARRSTINAHYTSEEVISWIWDTLKSIGINKPNGKVLEPAMGVGHFYGLNTNDNQKLFGVELDPISGKISQQLYPDADIRISGFENVTFPENFFDLAVGNVPFADIKPYDKKYNKGSRLSLHDYFFNKTLALTKPNGVVAFITSRYTMDKIDTKFRESVSKQADIIGAVRLPNTAFKGIANTEVTTDLIILKKRPRNTEPSELTKKFIETGQDSNGININKYYLAHPDHMAGNMALTGSMYGANEPTLEPFKDRSLTDVLSDITGRIKENAGQQLEAENDAETFVDRLEPDYSTEDVSVPHGTVVDAYFVDNNKLYQLKDGMPVLIRKRLPKQKVSEAEKKFVFNSKDYDKVLGLTKIKAAMKEVMRTQLQEATDSEKGAARKELNKVYDDFVKKHGFINTTNINVRPHPEKEGQEIVTKRYPNLTPFSADPDQLLVSSIEEYNEETGKGVKGAIFKEDIVKLHREVQNVSSPADALIASLNKYGEVDLEYMANIYGKHQDEIIDKLYGESIYFDPVQNKFVVADEYLSGDVKQKLEEAKNKDLQAIYPDSSFIDKNIMALEAVQPADIEPGDITARLGASWIPESDIQDFINELLGSSKAKVSHNGKNGKWTVKLDDYSVKNSPANTSEWGTDAVYAHKLIELALNLQQPTVRRNIYVDGSQKSVLDVERTELAADKQMRLKDKFGQWIWSDTDRAQRLSSLYNDKFNNTVIRDFNGSHLTFPGMRPVGDWFKGLRPHQANVVWRILQQGNTLMAHTVGAGKTIAMVTAGMELKRLGLVNKPTYVVPNHMLEQFSRELLQLYPTAKILVADKNNLDRKSRKGFVSKAATGNWDAIVITHSSFELLPVHPDTESVFVQKEIDNYEDLIREAKADNDRNITKQLEKAKEKLKAKLSELSNRDKKDTGIYFEETGIDFLFVDEAHLYKNLATPTKMKGKNLPNASSASQRALDMFMKVQYLNEKNPGRAAVFATGTPVANSMSELYTMQRYLQPDVLEKNGIEHFDSWAGTFGEMVTNLELDPTGAGLKIENRFAKFVNLPELMQMFRQVTDIKTATDLKLPIPKLKGGKAQIIEAKPSPDQLAYVGKLADRLKSIKGKRAEKGADNALRIVNDGRHAALDLRTVIEDTYDFEDSKVNKAVEKIVQIWKDTKKSKAVQVVFLDLSTPGKDKFSVYDDMREKLVKAGIPLKEIAFIHDYSTDQKKARLFDDARAGKVRVLFGTTAKMGVGTNIQKRLYAMHHMDAPWRPADVEQRDGRILRQGNENDEVEILRYVTSGTFDAYMWQTLEVKHNFITQVMRGDTSIREMEDLDGESALDPATVKAIASGNPRILDLAKMKADYKKLQRLQSAHVNEQVSIDRSIKSDQRYRDNSKTHLQLLKDTKKVVSIPEEFSITIDGKQYTKKKDEAGKALLALAKKKTKGKDRDSIIDIGSYAGVKISARPSMGGVGVIVGDIREIGTDERTSPSGIIQSVENTIKNIDKSIADAQASIENQNKNIEKLKSLLGKPFDKLDEMNQLKQEIADLEKELKEELEAKPEEQEDTDNETPSYLASETKDVKIKDAGKIDPLTEKLRVKVGKDQGITFPKGTFKRVRVSDSISDAVRRGFGVEVVFFKNTRPDLFSFAGVHVGGTIYINADGNYTYRQIVGHELLHYLRRTRPDLYDELSYLATYKIGLNVGEMAEYKKRLDSFNNKDNSNPFVIEEALADFVGEMFADPNILDRLEVKRPGFVVRLLEAIREFLQKALGRMRVIKDLRGSQYFNDTQELADLIEDVLKRFKNADKALTFDEYTSFSPSTRISPYTNNLGLYSALEKAVGEMDFKMIPPKMLINRINNIPGIKSEELEWSGIIEWLGSQEGKVSKEQVMDFIKAGGVKLEEVVKGDEKDRYVYRNGFATTVELVAAYEQDEMLVDENGELRAGLRPTQNQDGLWNLIDINAGTETKYDNYTLGAEPDTYREVLLTMPVKPTDLKNKDFTSSHWNEKNVLVHFRIQEKTTADGKKTLLVEEIQSDWHQAGRKKGYKKPVDKEVEKKLELINRKKDELYMKFQQFLHDNEYLGYNGLSDAMIDTWNKPKDFLIKHYGEIMPADIAAIPDEFNKLRSEGLEYHIQIADNKAGVPDAPFKNSDAWAMLAFKRILNMAVSEGYDSVSWTPGDIQAERYDLSKHVSEINASYSTTKSWNYRLFIKDKTGINHTMYANSNEELVDTVGKEMAEKIIADLNKENHANKVYSGLDLKIGGEGMKGFYDKVLRDAVSKYIKKLDKNAKLSTTEIRTKPVKRGKAEVWTVDLTPKMKDEIMEGQPMFLRQSYGQTFKEWIKDSVVKEPVYHGTNKSFNSFNQGISWFSTDPSLSRQYSDAKAYLSESKTQMTYPVYLKATKPFNADRLPNSVNINTFMNEIVDQAKKRGTNFSKEDMQKMNGFLNIIRNASKREESGPAYTSHNFWHKSKDFFGDDGAKAIMSMFEYTGFDSISYTEQGFITYGVFSPNQIKSAYNPAMVDKNTTLDPDNENIMYLGNRPEDEQLSNYENVEQEIKDSYGLNSIGLMTKIKDWLRSVKDGFTRHFEHLDTRKYGELADVLRVYESTPERAKIKATQMISKAIENLDKSEYNIFQRYIILKDMMGDIDKGLIGDGNLPFGFETVEQVMADWDSIHGKVTPKIQTALDTRYRMMESVRDALVDAGLLPETVLENDSYYRHQVLAYMNIDDKYATKPGTSSADIRKKKKGWMKSRTGSDLNYNTNYLEAEFEYVAQAIAQLETVKTLKRVRGMVDISDDLKAQAKEQRNETGDDTITWQSLIPEGYVKWQPEKGNSFYPVLTMPEDQVAALLDGEQLTPEEIQIVERLALGKKKLEWVIPQEVAETFDNFREFKDQNTLFAFYRHMMGTWKQWILLNPVRWIKYNLNNMSGDLDIVLGYNPKILKYGREAWRELWKYSKTDEMSADMKEAIELNVVGSGMSIAEIPDINKVGIFKDLAGKSDGFIKKYVRDGYWSRAKGMSNFRENWLRFAAYKHFKAELAKGKKVYGASKRHEIDAIVNRNEKAAKLARELLGDYGNISHIGSGIRQHIIPFWSWMEINFPRYVRLFKNVRHEGGTGGRFVVAKTAAGSARLTAQMATLYVAITLWNSLLFSDEEDELKLTGRGQLHLILGRRDDGSIRTLRIQGALSDALAWFGMEDAGKDIRDLKEGNKTFGTQAKEALLAPVQRLVNSALPMTKAVGEALTGFTIYPDIANPRAITDRTEHFARLFSLDMIYRYAAGKPQRELTDNLFNLVGYTADPEMGYYYKTYEMIDRFKRENNIDDSGAHKPNKRGVILLELKRSLRYGDEDAAKRYLEKYIKTYDGNIRQAYKGLKQSIKMADPLMKVKKDYRRKFLEDLTPKEREIFDKAREWYKSTYKDYMQGIKWSDFRDLEK